MQKFFYLSVLICSNFYGFAQTNSTKTTFIDGLFAAAIYKGFEQNGFRTTKQISEGFIFCEKRDYSTINEVRIYAPKGADKIEEIRGAFSNLGNGNTNKLASQFLGYLATIEYKNSSSQIARDWVIKNIGKNAKTKIGGVSFEIIANSDRNRTLFIRPIIN